MRMSITVEGKEFSWKEKGKANNRHYSKEQIMKAIHKYATYTLDNCGNHPNQQGYFFRYCGEVGKELGCSAKSVTTLVAKRDLRPFVAAIRKRERNKHIAKMDKISSFKCTKCKKQKPVGDFGLLSKLTLCKRRRECKECYNGRIGPVKNAKRVLYKYNNPEAYARRLLVSDLKREYGVTMSGEDLPEDMVEQKMRAIDMHRERRDALKNHDESRSGNPDKICTRCEETKPCIDFPRDYTRNGKTRRCFVCKECCNKKDREVQRRKYQENATYWKEVNKENKLIN